MNVNRPRTTLVTLGAMLVVSAQLLAAPPKQNTQYHHPITSTSSALLPGSELYQQNCAGCHGADGKGVGPTSPYCAVPPTNLTQLTNSNKGQFPEKRVAQVLHYGTEKPARSTAYMPVWKPLLVSMYSDSSAAADARINNLTQYLKSIQAKPSQK